MNDSIIYRVLKYEYENVNLHHNHHIDTMRLTGCKGWAPRQPGDRHPSTSDDPFKTKVKKNIKTKNNQHKII